MDQNSKTRRDVLASIGGVGVAGFGIGTVRAAETTRIVARYRHTNHQEVVNGQKPRREKVYETYPAADIAEIRGARKIARQLHGRLPRGVGAGITGRTTDEPGVDVVVAHTTIKRANGTTSNPSVRIEEVRRRVPEEAATEVTVNGTRRAVDNIRVVVKQTVEKELKKFDDTYNAVPGGCQFAKKGGGGACTVGTPAHSDEWGAGWLTASHCLDRQTGDEYEQAKGGTLMGTSREATATGDGDVGFIARGDSLRPQEYAVADDCDECTSWEIKGVETDKQLATAAYYGTEVYQQGITTGRNKTPVAEYYPNGKVSPHPEVVTDYLGDDGDSGGPVFDKRGDSDGNGVDELYMSGTITRGTDTTGDGYSDDTISQATWWAEDKLDVTV